MVVNPNLTSDGLIGLDILTYREHKSSYLAQTRSKTKGKRRIKTRLSTTTSNEPCESRESSPTPPSDTDDTDQDSISTVNSDEEESATDSELPNNTQYQPTDISDLPEWADYFFTTARVKRTLTCQQKRQEKQLHASRWGATIPLDGGVEQMRKAQEEDLSLLTIRRKCECGKGPYIKTNRLIYQTAKVHNRLEESHQLVLPAPYREVTLRLAHISPLAAHFGRTKTTEYIHRHFVWPGLRRAVAEMCKRCQTCQKTARGSLRKAKLVPLPVIEVPFTRIAMDMVYPLPRTEEGHRFILTIVELA